MYTIQALWNPKVEWSFTITMGGVQYVTTTGPSPRQRSSVVRWVSPVLMSRRPSPLSSEITYRVINEWYFCMVEIFPLICFVENLSENKNHAHYITIFDIQILVLCMHKFTEWYGLQYTKIKQKLSALYIQ